MWYKAQISTGGRQGSVPPRTSKRPRKACSRGEGCALPTPIHRQERHLCSASSPPSTQPRRAPVSRGSPEAEPQAPAVRHWWCRLSQCQGVRMGRWEWLLLCSGGASPTRADRSRPRSFGHTQQFASRSIPAFSTLLCLTGNCISPLPWFSDSLARLVSGRH